MKHVCYYQSVSTVSRTGQELKDFTITINEGESIALLGTNGSGKTVVGNLLNGDLEIVSGSFEPAQKVALVSFEKIQQIIEEDWIEADITEATILNPGLTCSDLIQQEAGTDAGIEEYLEIFKLSSRRSTAIRHLSTGEIAKCLLIGAMLSQPDLLILDEPFDGLDVTSRAVVGQTISQIIKSGTALLCTLNRIDEIPQEVTTIALMDKRSIILCGDAQEVLQSEAIHYLFSLEMSLPETLPGEQRQQAATVDTEGNLVTMKDITVQFGDKKVLNKINWQLSPGEHWKISGPNGCGKSTLLSLISGDHPQAYQEGLTLFGMKRGSGESIWDLKKHIGLVSTLLQRDYRVSGSVLSIVLSGFYDSIGLYTKSTKLEQQEAEDWLTIIGLEKKKRHSFSRLSYGEQRMVLIVRAMVKRPEVLILDEPCLGLDPINRELVLRLVDHIAQTGETTVLYVTHHDEDYISSISATMQFVEAPGGGYTIQVNK